MRLNRLRNRLEAYDRIKGKYSHKIENNWHDEMKQDLEKGDMAGKEK